jgi:hypothetical protein
MAVDPNSVNAHPACISAGGWEVVVWNRMTRNGCCILDVDKVHALLIPVLEHLSREPMIKLQIQSRPASVGVLQTSYESEYRARTECRISAMHCGENRSKGRKRKCNNSSGFVARGA